MVVIVSASCGAVDLAGLRYGCARDLDCADGWYCERSTNACARGTPDAGGCGTRCGASEVCDPELGRCRGDCEPSCLEGTVCDLVRNRCIFPGGACISTRAAAVPSGLDARFLDEPQGGGQVPRDVLLAGSAVCAADGVRLTSSEVQSGGLWATEPVFGGSFRLSATLTVRPSDPPLGRGDGLALVWSSATPGALGGAGAFLGYAGLEGYAVELDTVRNGGDARCTTEAEPEAVHVALVRTTTASAGSACGAETFAAARLDGPPLDGVELAVELSLTALDRARVVVTFARSPVIDVEIPYVDRPRGAAVTAATGSMASAHVVTHLTLAR